MERKVTLYTLRWGQICTKTNNSNPYFHDLPNVLLVSHLNLCLGWRSSIFLFGFFPPRKLLGEVGVSKRVRFICIAKKLRDVPETTTEGCMQVLLYKTNM